MIFLYLEQIIGCLVYISFSFTILLFIQFKQKQNARSRRLSLMPRWSILALTLSTAIYVQSLFNRFEIPQLPNLNLPYTENAIPGFIDDTPLKPHRKIVDEKIA
jgi:hypothetical protein